MKHTPHQSIDIIEIDREARRLRAQVVRQQFSALGAWLRERTHAGHGKAA